MPLTAINDAIDGLVKVTRISDVTAIKANQIQVTFNQPVDPTKATFVLKKGTTTVSLKTAVWNDDETVAVLERASSNFLAGDYVLTTSGLTDTALTNNLTILAQKVDSIEVVGDNIIKAANGQTATFNYVVKDQYGTDITTTTDLQATASTGTGTISLTKATKLGTVTYDFTQTTAPTTVVVTLVHTATGESVSKTLTVSAAAAVDTFEIGDIVYPEGKTRIYEDTASAAKINYTAMDQYGTELTGDLTGAVSLLSSDANTAVFTFVPKSGTTPQYINVETKNITEAKTVVLTAVVVAKGTVTTKSIDVVLAPTATTVEFGAIDKDTVAIGDTAYMDVVVTNQFGDVMAPKDYVTTLNASLTATASLSGKVSVVSTKTDANYGKIKLEPTGTAGLATIVSTLSGKTYSTTVDVQEARVLSEIAQAPAANLIQGASKQLKFVYRDQYGDVIDTVTDRTGTTYAITLEKVSGDDGAVTLTSPAATGAAESNLNNIVVAANASKTGVYNVTVELLDGSSNVLTSAVSSVTVTANAAEGLTYSVVNIPTLPAFGAAAVDGSSPYAKIVEVQATDANGNTVTINPAQILSVEILNNTGSYVQVSGTAVSPATITAQDGYFLVGAAKAADANVPTNAKLRVTINTTAGAQVLESNVISFSSAAPVSQELIIASNDVDAAVPTEKPDGELSEFDYATLAAAKTGTTAYAAGKDQYGVWTSGNMTAIVNSPASVIDLGSETFDFTAGTFALSGNPVSYTSDTAITLSIVKDGLVKTFTTSIAADTLAVGSAAVAQPSKDIVVTLTTGTFDAVGAVDAANWTIGGADGPSLGAITGVALSNDNKTATVTVTNATAAAKTYTVAGDADAYATGYTAPAAMAVTIN